MASKDLIVIGGFPSVWWLAQIGFPDAGGPLGLVVCSDEQANIVADLVSPMAECGSFPTEDGDESGERCAKEALIRISPHRFIRWVNLDEVKQPTDYPAQFFREALR